MSDFNYGNYRRNRLAGRDAESLRRFYADPDWFETIYRAEQRCNETASGFDLTCNRLECQRERKCQRCA